MEVLSNLIQKAATSNTQLWLLNRFMNYAVRFNRPHRFKISKITPDVVQTFAPYIKKNFNHVRGIHACAIATVGELAAGMLLMFHFSPAHYRVIMSRIEIDYHYQAKKDVTATARLSLETVTSLQNELQKNGKAMQTVITTLKDTNDTEIATVKTIWQVKTWLTVKTKL